MDSTATTPEKETGDAAVSAPPPVAENPPPPVSEIKIETVTADELAAQIAGAMPEPTESKALPGATAEAGTPPPAPGEKQYPPDWPKDVKGQPFDPERHAVGGDGKPKFNVNGFFVSKKIGRPRGSTGGGSTIAGTGEMDAPPVPGIRDRFDVAAETNFDLATGVAAAFISREWLPENPDEKALVTKPLAKLMRRHQTEEMPDWLELSLMATLYTVRRAAMPETQTWWGKVRAKLGWVKGGAK